MSLALINTAAHWVLSNRYKRLWPHADKHQKLDFLQRLDRGLPDMFLCKFCLKFVPWRQQWASSGHLCVGFRAQVPRPIQVALDHDLDTCGYQLVMRARHYRDYAYGPRIPANRPNLPITWLWLPLTWVVNETVNFDHNDNLVLRVVTATAITPGRLPRIHGVTTSTCIGTCACSGSDIHRKLLTDLRDILRQPPNGFQCCYWPDRLNVAGGSHAWCVPSHQCPICFAIVGASWECRRLDHYRCHPYRDGHFVRIIRYHNLGPARDFNAFPVRKPFRNVDSPLADGQLEAAVIMAERLFGRFFWID
jgi:hypothetical protein